MSDRGWSWGDLAGELMVRGIDIDHVSAAEIDRVLHISRPERAADEIERATS